MTGTVAAFRPSGALLVGSVPLGSAEDVFRRVGGAMGHALKRIPDGETGRRANWIAWQAPLINDHPAFEPRVADDAIAARKMGIRPNVDRAALEFPTLGYAAFALESYAVLERLQREGAVPASLRFQVALPTPLAPVVQRFSPRDVGVVVAAYERALFREIDAMLSAIPPSRLTIQWDVAIEMIGIEQQRQGLMPALPGFETSVAEQLVRLGNTVPEGVEQGYHLCFGDPGHRHLVEPRDTTTCVAMANAVATGLKGTVAFVHIPVPRDRSDDGYFEPLHDLRLKPETELYLGLVHHTDGLNGTLRRIGVAARHVEQFGIATECGWGRRAPNTIDELMRIHMQACEPAAQRS